MILLLSQTSKSGRTSKQNYTTCFDIVIVNKQFEFQISLYYSHPLELKKEDASYQQLKYVSLKCIPVFVIIPRLWSVAGIRLTSKIFSHHVNSVHKYGSKNQFANASRILTFIRSSVRKQNNNNFKSEKSHS